MENEELVDVYDASWRLDRAALPISHVHALGLLHAAAHLFITDGRGNMLMQHRHASKKILPDVLDISVAGHITAWDGSDGQRPSLFHQAALTVVKEAREELGLQLRVKTFYNGQVQFIGITRTDMPIAQKQGEPWRHRVLDHNFVTCMPELDISSLVLEEGKVSAARWVPFQTILNDLESEAGRSKYGIRPPDNDILWKTAITAMQCMSRM